jgi:hypothetical protein
MFEKSNKRMERGIRKMKLKCKCKCPKCNTTLWINTVFDGYISDVELEKEELKEND